MEDWDLFEESHMNGIELWAKHHRLAIKHSDNVYFLTTHKQIDRDTKVTLSIVIKQKRDYYLVSVWQFTHKRYHWDWYTLKNIIWRESKVNKEEIVWYLNMLWDWLKEKGYV